MYVEYDMVFCEHCHCDSLSPEVSVAAYKWRLAWSFFLSFFLSFFRVSSFVRS